MPTFATPELITATLTTAGAEVRITASDRLDTVVLVEPINGGNKTDVKVAEKTEVDFTAGELSVKTIKAGDKDGSVAITIELPAGSKLVLNTAWTDVHADGPFGDCELSLASGQVQLDRIATLRGNLAAGGVAIGHVAGTVDIEGGAASVRIGEVEGTVKYRGSTGKVWIGHARSDVDLNGASGSFDIDRAEGSVTAKAANCPIRVGRMTRGQAELMNASGGIDVGIREGAAAAVDAESTKGQVRNSLPAQDGPGGSDDKVTVYARTRRDDIVIHRAAV
ncbi:DUF4097 family beta strand repeat-containing protein [Phytohabitans sp. ZYX-F-186]|uniref:DUF4097 family beta strand repeat-containing protein n=1 Tax=Phytohabitans maris TaxID=3071409 RepID=A0ABU0ZCM1_9ACTN|nr:DUF4097 family beta strand repeat-containing protein [Phytohabitans sp. ZYX-F-186]MDQ7904783.1 DUF4097 family beta strand repeat-containing protein [Phytohabitans sp. ZYX-F-186]